VRDHEGQIVREDGTGEILRLTSDPARLYGYSRTLVILDELVFWTTPNLRRAYAALTAGGGARSAPPTFTIATAGEASTRHDSILGTLLDAALDAEDVERETGLTVARMPAAKDVAVGLRGAHQRPARPGRDEARQPRELRHEGVPAAASREPGAIRRAGLAAARLLLGGDEHNLDSPGRVGVHRPGRQNARGRRDGRGRLRRQLPARCNRARCLHARWLRLGRDLGGAARTCSCGLEGASKR